MTTPSICPKCGATIPDGAPQGLCPKCVLLGAATEIQSGARPSKAAAPPTVAEVGAHFPELEVLELLGAGGMGAVYKARQPKLDRFVALKILSSDLAGDPAFTERFDREARVLARLSHPNIVTVFDSGVAGPFAYLMMEFVDGVNLRQAMKAGRFTPPEALTLVQDICSALKFAHEKGILHRDIKPENILIDSRGQVKIADFGIAKLVGENDADHFTLTQRGFVLGSPHYMAPEQLESPGDVDQRADIYSLGVVLYELLTGELPIGRFALPSEKAAMDARIDEIVMRTLEKERERRYQTVSELKTGFERIESPAPPSQAAFINEQILEGAKYAFWAAIFVVVLLFIDAWAPQSGNTEELLHAAGHFPILGVIAILLSTISAALRIIHTIRTKGNLFGGNDLRLAPAQPPIRRDIGTAHLGLIAAILTGITLLDAGGALYAAYTLHDADTRMFATVLGISLDGTIAFLGLILGASALAQIRKSRGQKEGLGFAVFAVAAWPIIVMFGLTSLFLSQPMPGTGSSLGFLPILLLCGLPFLTGVVLFVRALIRWGGGVERGAGERHFPGLGRALLPAALSFILGPVLMVIALMALPSLGHHGPYDETMARMWKEENRIKATGAESSPEEEVRWRTGKPEVTVALAMQEGQKATLRAFLRDAGGNTWDFNLGEASYRPELPRAKVVFEFGTELISTMQRLVITKTVPDGRLIRSLEDLRGWEFNAALPEVITFDSVGKHEVHIAANKGRPSEALILELVVTK